MIFIIIILLCFPSKNDRTQSQHSTSSGRTLKRREKSIYHQLCTVSHGRRQCFFVIKYSDVVLLLRSHTHCPKRIFYNIIVYFYCTFIVYRPRIGSRTITEKR